MVGMFQNDCTSDGRKWSDEERRTIMTENKNNSGSQGQGREQNSDQRDQAGRQGGTAGTQGNTQGGQGTQGNTQGGNQGGSKGSNNPGNFANDPDRAVEAGRKGGEATGGGRMSSEGDTDMRNEGSGTSNQGGSRGGSQEGGSMGQDTSDKDRSGNR